MNPILKLLDFHISDKKYENIEDELEDDIQTEDSEPIIKNCDTKTEKVSPCSFKPKI